VQGAEFERIISAISGEANMKNVDMDIEQKNQILTIKIDLSKDMGDSKSGKSTIIATTEGNVSLGGNFEDVMIGLNVYREKVDFRLMRVLSGE
jgi:hypothetical protein